ncbi:MAG: hypothetical protein M1833_006191 [Piccolia ochrophora]|nr:MAG: hypothetical protein M1833_006191 [Piccolia ochrophora]
MKISKVPFATIISTLLASRGTSATDLAARQAPSCCDALQTAVPGKVFSPTSKEYLTSVSTYWAVQARLEPSCIVTPASSDEVSDVVKALVKSKCQFAIKSGGHAPVAGSNNIKDGVTVDLGALNDVTLSTDNKTASIGPGARWGEVYKVLDPLGVAVSGGRAASVGVGGLITGGTFFEIYKTAGAARLNLNSGGNSFFAARNGFVCDNVENFEIVLGSGEIVNANQSLKSDLFKALKGGSSNFGIVTRFDMFTFEQSRLWGGTVVYPSTTEAQQIKAFTSFGGKIGNDPYGSLISQWTSSAGSDEPNIVNIYEYTKPEADARAFDTHRAIEGAIANTMRIETLTNLTEELEAPVDLRSYFSTLTFANNETVMQEVVNISNRFYQKYKTVANLQWYAQFQPLPLSLLNHSRERGGNVLGLDRAKENLIGTSALYDNLTTARLLILAQVVLLFAQWSRAEDDGIMNEAAEQLLKEVKDYTVREKADNDWVYLNYAYPSQDPLKGYGPDNFNFIRATSQKYDPDQVFQKLNVGGFKWSGSGLQ